MAKTSFFGHTHKIISSILAREKIFRFNCYSKNAIVVFFCLDNIVFAVLPHQWSLAEGLRKESIHNVTYTVNFLEQSRALDGKEEIA